METKKKWAGQIEKGFKSSFQTSNFRGGNGQLTLSGYLLYIEDEFLPIYIWIIGIRMTGTSNPVTETSARSGRPPLFGWLAYAATRAKPLLGRFLSHSLVALRRNDECSNSW